MSIKKQSKKRRRNFSRYCNFLSTPYLLFQYKIFHQFFRELHLRMSDHILRPPCLHELPFFHHCDLIAEPADHIEVMGDKQIAQSQLFLEFL